VPHWGTWRGDPFTGDFEIRKKRKKFLIVLKGSKTNFRPQSDYKDQMLVL